MRSSGHKVQGGGVWRREKHLEDGLKRHWKLSQMERSAMMWLAETVSILLLHKQICILDRRADECEERERGGGGVKVLLTSS